MGRFRTHASITDRSKSDTNSAVFTAIILARNGKLEATCLQFPFLVGEKELLFNPIGRVSDDDDDDEMRKELME